jgi:two-component sensor histidine kinase
MIQLLELASSERSSFEARLLLREFSHRINNEFASAIGVISIAAARCADDEAKVALAAVQDRLQNYALVHHALQMPEQDSCIDAAAYLRQLCWAISRSKLERKGIELRFVERNPDEFRALLAAGFDRVGAHHECRASRVP